MKYIVLLIASLILVSCNNNITSPKLLDSQEVEKKKNQVKMKDTRNQKNILSSGFIDEFNGINKENWNLLNLGWKDHGRLHHYLDKNVKYKDGKLVLQVLKENYKNFNYTSGAVTTEGKVEMLYGKIEVRAKLPKGKGLLPAIWMLPSNGEAYPEIDIAEILGQKPTELWNVVHWEEKGQHKRDYVKLATKDLTKDFHIYGLYWKKDKIIWTLDGEITHESKFSPSIPMYLYMNVTVGGTWVGDPDDEQEFPQQMVIDYVKYSTN